MELETIMNVHTNTAIEHQVHVLDQVWHEGYFYVTLHAFLGLTWEQFQKFIKEEELPDDYHPPTFDE
jgi:hypothetical protein